MKQFTLIFTLLLLGTIISISSSGGRPGAWANAPGDSGYCNACHTSSGAGSITLTGAPTSYIAGQTYNMTLTLSQAAGVVGGFQIVATNGTNNTNIGNFNPGFNQKLNDINRLVQSTPKSFAFGSVSWPISWTAPASAPSNVRFYFAGNAANGNGSNGAGDIAFAGSSGLIPLPVELSSFTAHHQDGQGNVIQWITATQKNLDRFELLSSQDGQQYEIIHSTKGEKNTSTTTAYSFTDLTEKKITYYKLNMIDLDGHSEFSNIISVLNKKQQNLQVSPNPVLANQSFSITSNSTDVEQLQVSIFTMSGQLVNTQQYQVKNNSIVTISANDFKLAKGQYILQTTDLQGLKESGLLQVR